MVCFGTYQCRSIKIFGDGLRIGGVRCRVLGGAWHSAGRFFHTSLCDDFFQGNDLFLQFHDFLIHKDDHLFPRIKLNFIFRRIRSDFTSGWGQVIIGIIFTESSLHAVQCFQLDDFSWRSLYKLYIPRPLKYLFFFYLSTFLLLRIGTQHTENSLIT